MGRESLVVGRFVCPRGHRHYEGSAFCTVCGAGPVLRAKYEWCGRCGAKYDGKTPHGPGHCEPKAKQ